MDILILVTLNIDEGKPVAEQLAADSEQQDYEMDEEYLDFLTAISGLKWADLTSEQKDRVTRWLFANRVYKGVTDFRYTTCDPDISALKCPGCGSGDLSFHMEEGGADEAIEQVTCHACNAVFNNYYTLTGQVIQS